MVILMAMMMEMLAMATMFSGTGKLGVTATFGDRENYTIANLP